jgi:hypothetical protein
MIQKKTRLVQSAFILAAFYLIAITTLTGSVASASPVAQTSEKISLSIGNVLSTLNIDVTAMVLSKDKKIAFTTVSYYGTLKIVDISNENYPSVIGSLALKQTGPVFKFKTLALSSDEKTLYVSNSRDLEIIDISNLEAPVLLSFTKSTIFDDISFLQTAGNFRTSMAIDEQTKTLFIGGLGLQVFDILNPQHPALLSASKNDIGSDGKVERNEIALVQEKEMLIMANRNLYGYDVSSPRDVKVLFSFTAPSAVRSLLLSDDSKTVYLLGNAADKKLRLAEVDISDPKFPVLVNDYDTRLFITNSTGFLTVSPNKTKFYFYSDTGSRYKLLTFDTIRKETLQNENIPSLVDNVYAMAFSHDAKTLIAGSKDQFVIIDLPKDYPNSQILESAFLFTSFDLASSYQNFMQMAPDGTIFILRTVTQAVSPRLYSVLDIYSGDQLLGSYEGDQSFIQVVITKDYNTVYLLARQTLYAIDVTDRVKPMRIKTYMMKDSNIVFSRFLLSEDGKTGFIATREGDNSGDAKITVFQFTDSSYIEGLATIDKIFAVSNVKMIRYRTTGLIVIDKEISIYNVSNINAPVLIFSLPLGDHEIPPFVSSALLSPDNNTLYVDIYDDNQFTSLRIYDVTNLKSPALLSELALPRFDPQTLRPPFFLSRDQQSGYVLQDNSLLKLNLSNLNYPSVAGVISLPSNKTEKMSSLFIFEDGQLAFSVTGKKQVKIFALTVTQTLYLKQEKFLLGQKYSDTVSLLSQRGAPVDYDYVNPSSYKIIKLSLVDIRIAPNLFALKSTTTPLPSWITFDKQTNSLTVEPKTQAAIGSYAFQVGISVKISTQAFSKIEGLTDSSEDVLAALIGLGYVDPQFFLTTHFGSYEDFLLPSKYNSYKAEIYNILQSNYLETSTGFSVVPSLSLKHTQGDSIAVSTLSTNDILLDIKLYPYSTDSQVKFLSKQYDLVLAALSEAKSRIVLEGPLADVNAALRSVIVDFTGNSTSSSYDAFVSVSDGLNPPITAYISNASQYFLHNAAPIYNPGKSSLQEQIDQISIATGQYFNIQLDPNSFTDKNGNELSYHFEMYDQTAEIPSWIVFEKLTLHGTAPEDLTGRSLKMALVVNNEFRQLRVPFTLNVKLTTMTVIKLVVKVAFILLMVVLAISTIKSCGKKQDEMLPRDSKEYLLRRADNELY